MSKENQDYNLQPENERTRYIVNRLKELNKKLQDDEIPEEVEVSVIQLILDYENMFTLSEKGIVNQPDLSKPISCNYSNPREDEKLLCRPNELNRIQVTGTEEFNPNRTAGFAFVASSVDADYYGEMKPINNLTIYPDRLTLLPFDKNYNFGERHIFFETPQGSTRLEFFAAVITPDREDHIIGRMPLKVED